MSKYMYTTSATPDDTDARRVCTISFDDSRNPTPEGLILGLTAQIERLKAARAELAGGEHGRPA